MISISTWFRPEAVTDPMERAELQCLTRAGAYVRQVARRSIKKRKNTASQPGNPPYEHGTFRNTIRFAVDAPNRVAYVGAMRIDRNKPGATPAPQTLEFGGLSTPGRKPRWWRRKNAEKVTGRLQLAEYIRHAGFAPIYAAETQAELVRQATHGKTHKVANWSGKTRIICKYSPVLRKKVYLIELKIRSERMLERSADNVERFFGYGVIPQGKIKPRPYMAPALEKSQGKIAEFIKRMAK